METKTINVVPVAGEFAIIQINNGTLEIYNGNVNKKHDDLYLIEECSVADNQVHIKAKQMNKIEIDSKVTELEGSQTIDGKEFNYKDIMSMVMYPENVKQTFHKKQSWWMKLRGKPEIKFDYIVLDNISHWSENPRRLILKTDYWHKKEFKTNQYIFKTL